MQLPVALKASHHTDQRRRRASNRTLFVASVVGMSQSPVAASAGHDFDRPDSSQSVAFCPADLLQHDHDGLAQRVGGLEQCHAGPDHGDCDVW